MIITKLEKTYTTNTRFSTGLYDVFVIERIGSAVDVSVIRIDGREISAIDSVLQPRVLTSSNLFGPFDLKDLFLVVPPQKTFEFVAATTGRVVLEGKHIMLDVGEGVPSELISRFNEQDKVYYNPITFSRTLATNESIPAGGRVLLAEFRAEPNRKYIFDNIAGFSITNFSLTDYGTLALQFEINGRLLDTETATYGTRGIDAFNLPLPPTMTTNAEPFSFEEFPITLEPNYLLRIYVANVGTTAVSPPSGAALTLTFKAMARVFEL